MIAAPKPMLRGFARDGEPRGLFVSRDGDLGICVAMSDGCRSLTLPISEAEALALADTLRGLARAAAN